MSDKAVASVVFGILVFLAILVGAGIGILVESHLTHPVATVNCTWFQSAETGLTNLSCH